MLAAVVLVAVVAAGAVAAVLLLGGDDGEAKDREALGVAAADGDVAEIKALAEERPELLETTESIEVGEANELAMGEDGYVIADLDLDGGVAYTFAVEGSGDPSAVILDDDLTELSTEPRLAPDSGGAHTVVVGGTGPVTLTVVPVLEGEVDITQEQVTELDVPGQIVELTVDVLAVERYELAILEGDGYGGRLLDEDGTEVAVVPDDGSYVRVAPESDATYLLVLEAPDGSTATSLTTDVIELARWTAYSGDEDDAFYLEEEIEPDEILPNNDSARDAITWCIDLIDGAKITFEIDPSLDGSVWELRSYDSEASRQAGDATNTYDDIVEGNTITIEASGGDATFCYEMRLMSEGSSSVDLHVTDETE